MLKYREKVKERRLQERLKKQVELEEGKTDKETQKVAEIKEEKKKNNKIYYIAGAIGLIGTIIILYKTRKK